MVVPPRTHAVVVAPHPDDETIAAGGLIQRVLESGGTVEVVVVTDGDGYPEAAAALTGDPTPDAEDFRLLGARRREETLAAARVLGLRPEAVRLLGFPDGGLDRLWGPDWSASRPYVSPYTGRGPFAGEALYAALRSVLEAKHPTLVVAPDPRDAHPDHARTGSFVLAAAGTLVPPPEVLTYVVHADAWPPPVAADDVEPPAAVAADGTRWYSLELTPQELDRKRAALAAYRTQLPVLGGLLARFLRPNELFAGGTAGGRGS